MIAPTAYRGEKSIMRSPAVLKPLTNRPIFNAGNAAPFSKRMRLGTNRDHAIRAHVVRLFSPGGPSTILRAIALTVVDAIEALSFWFRAQIGKEDKEISAPCRTDRDASAPIIGVRRVIGIVTSLYHAKPNIKYQRLRHPMFCHARDGKFFPQAAARLRIATRQITSPDNDLCPTRTLAGPICAAAVGVGKLACRKAMKYLSGQVETWHASSVNASGKRVWKVAGNYLVGRSTLSTE